MSREVEAHGKQVAIDTQLGLQVRHGVKVEVSGGPISGTAQLGRGQRV